MVTGYVVVRLTMPDAGPVRFLAWRFGVAAILLAVAAVMVRAPWATRTIDFGHLALVGLLVTGSVSGGVGRA